MNQTVSTLHAAAMQLAQLGCAVFPCQPRGKSPATAHGCKDGTTDMVRINSWWRACPDMNIGIATGAVSGFFVVDIDGDEGEASLATLEKANGPLPATVEAITGKGRHCYFRIGEHGPVGNTAGQIGPGIDTRGDGGYLLAPPSAHPSGRPYVWSVDSAAEFADAPDWLHALIGADTIGKGKPLEHWHSTLTKPITNGTRNSTLASIAGKLFFHGLDVILISDVLTCINDARCETPLSPGELETIVLSVGKAHYKRAACWTIASINELHQLAEEARPLEFSDDCLALQFTAAHIDDLRFVDKWGRWLIWDGKRWAFDETRRVFDLAREICRQQSRRCNEPHA